MLRLEAVHTLHRDANNEVSVSTSRVFRMLGRNVQMCKWVGSSPRFGLGCCCLGIQDPECQEELMDVRGTAGWWCGGKSLVPYTATTQDRC